MAKIYQTAVLGKLLEKAIATKVLQKKGDRPAPATPTLRSPHIRTHTNPASAKLDSATEVPGLRLWGSGGDCGCALAEAED
jgi:hypothetical protein